MPLPSNSYETRRDEAAHGTSFLAKLRENENDQGQQLFIWTLAFICSTTEQFYTKKHITLLVQVCRSVSRRKKQKTNKTCNRVCFTSDD